MQLTKKVLIYLKGNLDIVDNILLHWFAPHKEYATVRQALKQPCLYHHPKYIHSPLSLFPLFISSIPNSHFNNTTQKPFKMCYEFTTVFYQCSHSDLQNCYRIACGDGPRRFSRACKRYTHRIERKQDRWCPACLVAILKIEEDEWPWEKRCRFWERGGR